MVVVFYNMAREAPRTLYSLSARYQRHIAADDYEIIAVDNGSNPALDKRVIDDLAGNFRLVRIDPAPPSPAHAINVGLAEARGEVIGVMIDGARLVTPGLLHFAGHAAEIYDNAVVASLGWHLGHDFQRMSVVSGYNQQREDDLLADIDWPRDGYRLFEIATLDEPSLDGWFFPTQESNALFMKRAMWDAIGGADQRFDSPGGGLLNLDIFRRAMELPEARLVRLLGEGNFHQLHGGVATNAPVEELHDKLFCWAQQYARIRGYNYGLPIPPHAPTYIGMLPRAEFVHFVRAAIDPVWHTIWPGSGVESPLGNHFNRNSWSSSSPTRPADPKLAAILDLAYAEFRARRYDSVASLCRLIYSRDPREQEPRRLLPLANGWLLEGDKGQPRSPDYHRALSKAYDLLGEDQLAALHKTRIRTSGVRQRLKPIAAATLDVVAALRHPNDESARQWTRLRLRKNLKSAADRFFGTK